MHGHYSHSFASSGRGWRSCLAAIHFLHFGAATRDTLQFALPLATFHSDLLPAWRSALRGRLQPAVIAERLAHCSWAREASSFGCWCACCSASPSRDCPSPALAWTNSPSELAAASSSSCPSAPDCRYQCPGWPLGSRSPSQLSRPGSRFLVKILKSLKSD